MLAGPSSLTASTRFPSCAPSPAGSTSSHTCRLRHFSLRLMPPQLAIGALSPRPGSSATLPATPPPCGPIPSTCPPRLDLYYVHLHRYWYLFFYPVHHGRQAGCFCCGRRRVQQRVDSSQMFLSLRFVHPCEAATAWRHCLFNKSSPKKPSYHRYMLMPTHACISFVLIFTVESV